jgi:glycosyltransferase involved in cell wall biosynthesis
MRVAVASWTARHAGGIESYVAAIMQAMRDAGLDVSFFHEADEPRARSPIHVAADIPVFSVASRGVDAAVRALSKWRPDVVYAHGLHDVDTADRLLAIAPSVTFVHTYVGTCISGTKTHMSPHPVACSRVLGPACLALYFPRRCGGLSPLTMVQLYAVQRRRAAVLSRQHAVITHSAHMREELRAHGIDATVIPYPISMAAADPSDPVAHTHDLLFAGRMDKVKGGTLLLDALPRIATALDSPIRVLLSGDGPERARWQSHATRIQARRPDISIDVPGWSSEANLSAQMKQSRLLVVPSVWPEPFGSVGLAAARYGVPAAAFAVGGIPQWLRDGVNGHLAPANPPTSAGLADAVIRCLEDPEHYGELSRGAREAAAQSTIDRHLPELIGVLDRVVRGRS